VKTIDQEALRTVVENVLARINNGQPAPATTTTPATMATPAAGTRGQHGVFANVSDAAEAAQQGYLDLCEKGKEARGTVIDIVKNLCTSNAEAWGKFELDETGIGRLDHKIEKLQIVKLVPGVEAISTVAMTGDLGITLDNQSPMGVIGAILPVTHSIPTLTGNIINMVAAGNAVLFNPHPGGAKSAALAVREYNKAIERELGIKNLICTIEKPSIESFNEICASPQVSMLAITGGPAVVEAALKSGKRAVCAGPGNPVVVVDDSADLANAATSIIAGAAFDNNLLCIGEKSVFVVESVFNDFMQAMRTAGAVELNKTQLEKLSAVAFNLDNGAGGCNKPVLNRDLIGADASVLASHAGLSVPSSTELIFAETNADHPYVQKEQMMPFLPIVRVPDFKTAVKLAKEAEHGYTHSSIIHSRNVEHMRYMNNAMGTTIFVKNGPSVAGLGLGGEGYLSYSIATTTGEGITTPSTFTRVRRCVLVNSQD
jgi:aldehyde dehydrogenase